MTSYSDDELASLRLLRRSYSWSIGMDFRSRVWVASFAGDRIRRDTPLSLFDAPALAAQARREIYLKDNR
jgi:hypothetical protein